ncbi:hypothetical protein C1645_836250 [Glomus cerebriforme]|uniref:F-box domain-containing protein n=1 Tax=Glomus cerebriforme TaxID=658196 RepID=A0A397SCZ1_9GLOM|nr:hypothetical protein C1645_836250 [Glomus cerebriforme]
MASSRLFSGFPELANQILQYHKDDFSTLFSCTLVNRSLCRITVPLLWENPFIITTRNYNFFKVYLQRLNNNDLMELGNVGIHIIPLNTLFNYPSFLKCLNILSLKIQIERWTREYSNFNSSFAWSRVKLIYKLLFKIITNEATLHTFEIMLVEPRIVSCFNNSFVLFYQRTDFIRSVKNLKLIISHFDMNTDALLTLLSFKCNSIKNLRIEFNKKLNKSNESNRVMLEKFSSDIINSHLNRITFDSNINHNLSLLKDSCSNNLRSIAFLRIDFSKINNFKEIMEHLNGLEFIDIMKCIIDSNFSQQLISINKQFKLRTLYIDDIYEIDSLKLLLQNFGNGLRNVIIGRKINDEMDQELLELMINFCKNIEYFNLEEFDKQSIRTVCDLIKNVGESLCHLSINCNCNTILYQDDENIRNSSELLQELGPVLPNRLEYFNLNLSINPVEFENFLVKSNDTFINDLMIENKLHENSILPQIKEHLMKNKRIKNISFDEGELSLFSRRNEVKEFKSHDICVFSGVELRIRNDRLLYD